MNAINIPEAIRRRLGSISNITTPEQGLTSHVVIIESKGKDYVLKHSTGRYAPWLLSEYRVLLSLEQASVPTARVHDFVEVKENGVHESWLLLDYIPGRPLMPSLEDPGLTREDRSRMYHACGKALAAIHATPPPPCLQNAADSWLDTLIAKAHVEQEKRAEVFDKIPAETQARHETLLRMEKTRPAVESFALIHGDCSPHHTLFDGTGMTGIIDWGCAAVGDPRYDIAEVLCVPPAWKTTEIDEDVSAFFEGYGTPPIPVDIIQYYQELSELGGKGCIQMPLT